MSQGKVVFDRVWKKFHRGEVHDSLRDLIPAMARRLVGRGPHRDELEAGDFWALRDVSFEVAPGEALGIIGPNGAGKSTVLKVLTNIMRPNRGRALVTGRAGALIEVAAGFHPDLTGAENVYLQGSIMGMSMEETKRSFDRIVEFAELADFIDTPVKRYSSGMNARLGFSIAAHLDPEVMIIDEVLAVGDFAFQRKAFQRMEEIVRRDIPVVIVSHQLDRVATLCTKAILLDRGRVSFRGDPGDCINAYVQGQSASIAEDGGDAPIVLESVNLRTKQPVESGEFVEFVMGGRTIDPEQTQGLSIAFRLRSGATGQNVYSTNTKRLEMALPPPGPFSISVRIQMNLAPGIYTLEPIVYDHNRHKVASIGPGSYLQVVGGPSFFGMANCHGEMCYLSPSETSDSE